MNTETKNKLLKLKNEIKDLWRSLWLWWKKWKYNKIRTRN